MKTLLTLALAVALLACASPTQPKVEQLHPRGSSESLCWATQVTVPASHHNYRVEVPEDFESGSVAVAVWTNYGITGDWFWMPMYPYEEYDLPHGGDPVDIRSAYFRWTTDGDIRLYNLHSYTVRVATLSPSIPHNPNLSTSSN